MSQGLETHEDIYWQVITKGAALVDRHLPVQFQTKVLSFFRQYDMAAGLILIHSQCEPHAELLANLDIAEVEPLILDLIPPQHVELVTDMLQSMIDADDDVRLMKILHFLYELGNNLSKTE